MVIRSAEACFDAAFLGDYSGVNLFAEVIRELCLVYLVVTAQEYDDIFIVDIFLIHNSLAGLLDRLFQICTDIFYCLAVGCIYLFKRLITGTVSRVIDSGFCGLHVCAVTAFITKYDGILARVCKQHIFMRNASAEHS